MSCCPIRSASAAPTAPWYSGASDRRQRFGAHMTLCVRELPGRRDLLPLATRFPARYPALLESVARGPARTRFDILFAFPGDVLRLDRDGCVRDARSQTRDGGFLEGLDGAWQAARTERRAHDELPFRGGWLLYLGYELAGEIEPKLRLPMMTQSAMPIALALRCRAAIIVDHARMSTRLVAEAGAESMLDAL